MVSANDKGKKPVEDDPQNPKEEETMVADEEDMKEEEHLDTRATVTSIGVVANPINLRRTTRMSTGGKPPCHCLDPRSLPPCSKNPFHTLIIEQQYQKVTQGNLPSIWDLPCSNHVGKEHTKKEEWGKNNKDWDSHA